MESAGPRTTVSRQTEKHQQNPMIWSMKGRRFSAASTRPALPLTSLEAGYGCFQ